MGNNKIVVVLLLGLIVVFSGCGYRTQPQDGVRAERQVHTEEQVRTDDPAKKHINTDLTSSSINFNMLKEEGVNTIDARPFLEKKLYQQDIQSDTDGITDSVKVSDSVNSVNSDKSAELIDSLDETNFDYMQVIGGIIPHHTVAHKMINQFYNEISKKNSYDLIIVVSPNHASLGPRFQVGMRDYLTYDGVVPIDKVISKTLIDETIAVVAEDKVIEKEHGQLVHMHYINHYFKDVPVISIMINETRKYNDIEGFRDQLVDAIQGKKVLLIGSIDFSHYLTLEAANKNDEVTRSLLQTNNSRQMISQNNDFIDSPSTYALIIEVMQSLSEFDPTIVDHDNSATILNQKALKETTSYFSVVYVGNY